MNSSESESIRNACFNLERLSRYFRLARPGISPLERLWNGFDSDAELNHYNVFCMRFDGLMNMFRFLNLVQLQLRSASEAIYN